MAGKNTKLTSMHNGAVERPVDLRKLWAIVVKNWLVLKGDKIRLVPLILFPVIMITLFGYASGNIPKHVPVGIVDYDNTEFSRMVLDQFSGMDSLSVKYISGTQDEGRKLLDSGAIRALFILPEGLSEKVASGQPAQIEVMVDASDSSVAQVAKSSAQVLANRLSAQVAAARLAGISANANAARGSLAAASAVLEGGAGNAQTAGTMTDASAAYFTDAGFYSSKASKMAGDTAQGLRNSLGYLVDQNEIAGSYTPASTSTATLALLATGDSQQATLQQAAMYSILGGMQSKVFFDTAAIYSNSMKLAGMVSGQAKGAAISAEFIGSADSSLGKIAHDASQVQNPIEITALEPYGYGRRAIDFLLPSMLAMIIFQGASMGLGRAIAGERKDGSLTRVFLTPTSNTTIILGTQLFYFLLETIRSSLIIFVAFALFGITISGNMVDIIVIIGLFALGATGVGMVLSVMTKNQDQYMAIGMLISMPIMFLSGVFFPIQTMPEILQGVAQVLPITYAADALRGIMVKGFTLAQVMPDIMILVVFWALMFALSLLLFKRELA